MLAFEPSQDPSNCSRFRSGHSVVMFLYLVAGAFGLILLMALMIEKRLWYAYGLLAMGISAIGWIPGVVLVVIYRNSWRVVIPAVILIGCLAFLMTFGLMDDATIGLTKLFFVTAFLVGLEWNIQELRKQRHD